MICRPFVANFGGLLIQIMKISHLIIGAVCLIAGAFLGPSFISFDENNLSAQQEAVEVEGASGRSDATSQSSQSTNQAGKRTIAPETTTTSQEQATISLFESTSPSVVYITTSNNSRNYWSKNVNEIPQGSGSGFIWDDKGHIVTNFHVIEGAQNFTVTLSDQSSYKATFVGAEPNKDLAVLKIEAPKESLPPILVGSYGDLKVGQSVYAIGNPFGLDYSLTTGVISALGREIEAQNGTTIKDVIQTDAAINPGNSGGPLLDSSRRLIGVNTMIYSPSGASAGIGFAIPVDVVNWVVPDIITYGRVNKPVLGIELVPAQSLARYDIEGVMIMDVYEGSGAADAGLRPVQQTRSGSIQFGDIIVGINNDKIRNYNDLVQALEKYAPKDVIKVIYIRDSQQDEVDLTLGSSVQYQ